MGFNVTDVIGVFEAVNMASWVLSQVEESYGAAVCCESRRLAVPSEEMTGESIELLE